MSSARQGYCLRMEFVNDPTPIRSDTCCAACSGGMMIKVKTLTGKEIEIDIEPNDTIERIKERVEEKEGIPPIQQRCAYALISVSDQICWTTSQDDWYSHRTHVGMSMRPARCEGRLHAPAQADLCRQADE